MAEGPEGWSAEARYQRWDDGDRCRARVRVALFEPGGTWEDEALVPASILEAPADPGRVPEAAMRWRDGRLEVAGASFDAHAITRGARDRGLGRPPTP